MTVLIALLLSQASDAWTVVAQQDGVTLESRPVTGSDFYEYRASADTDVAVEVLCDRVYEWGSLSKDHDNIKARRLLEDSGDVRVVYDQMEPPMVSRRDFAFTVRRTRTGPGRCGIDFFATNEKAPPKPEGWIRIEKLRGGWRFEKGPRGTHVTYTCFADPGGSLPPVFVHSSQREAAVSTLRKGIQLCRVPATH
jgi:hypothetical protein